MLSDCSEITARVTVLVLVIFCFILNTNEIVYSDPILDVSLLGDGCGSINSIPSGAISCSYPPLSGKCFSRQPPGTSLSLTATECSDSLFSGWHGACASCLGKSCQILLDDNKSCSASFYYLLPFRVNSTPATYYGSFQDAYSSSSQNSMSIKIRNDVYYEDLSLDRTGTFEIQGGYDKLFRIQSGHSTFNGNLIVKAANVVIDKLILAPSPIPPVAPVNLLATAGDKQVSLSWDPVYESVSYDIYVGNTPGVNQANSQKIAGIFGTSHDFKQLSNGTKYYFRVAARNSAGEGSLSEEISATPGSAKPVSIKIYPMDFLVTKGKTRQFRAIGSYSDGAEQEITAQVSWKSSNQGIASIGDAIGSKGMLIANNCGKATITATDGFVSTNAEITVTSTTLESISIDPAAPSIPLNLMGQFVAIGTYTDGTSHDVTSSVSWSSADETFAIVGDDAATKGIAIGLSAGTVSITATLDNVVGTTNLTILPYKTLAADVTEETFCDQPSIAIDGSDNVLAAWTYTWPYPDEQMYLTRLDRVGGWSPVTVYNMDSDQIKNPHVVLNETGVGLLVWTGKNGLYSSLYLPGKGWQPYKIVASGESVHGTYAEVFDVKIDSEGNGLLVWSQQYPTGYYIFSSRYTISTGWSNPEFLGNTNDSYGNFAFAADKYGNAVLLWENVNLSSTGKCILYANIFSPTDGWLPATVLIVSDFHHKPLVARNDNGKVLAIWNEESVSSETYYASWYTSTSGWQPPEAIGISGGLDTWSLALGPNDDAVVVWSNAANFNVYVNRFRPSAGWQGTEVIRELHSTSASNPHVQIDAHGNILAGWNEDEGYNILATKRYLSSSGWQPHEYLSAGVGPVYGYNMQFISNLAGTVAIAWMENYGIFDGQYFRSFFDLFYTEKKIDGSPLNLTRQAQKSKSSIIKELNDRQVRKFAWKGKFTTRN